MYSQLLVLCMFFMQSIFGLDKEIASFFHSKAESHPAITTALVAGTILGASWLVTRPARERRNQEALQTVLSSSKDVLLLASAYRDANESNKKIFIDRCTRAVRSSDRAALILLAQVPEDLEEIFEHRDFTWTDDQRLFLAQCMPLLAQSAQSKLVTYLVKKNLSLYEYDARGYYAVHCAAEVGSDVILRLLVTKDRKLKDYRTPDRMTALMVAAKKGHSHCIELLWQCSDAQAFDQNFLTAVHHAVIEGHQGVVKKLIALIKKDLADGASIGAYLDDADLLHYALYNNCFDCASYFVSEGADGTRMDKVGNLPLHIVAYKPHCPEVLLDFIIAQSREKDLLSVSNAESKTPLDIALVSGSPKIQTALQQAGGIASLVLHKKAKEKNGNK